YHIKRNENAKTIVAFVREKGGIDYAQRVMQTYQKEALDILKSLTTSEARTSMEELIEYVIERRR
ncbi:MAG: polyprenyl synthetase family protein, partial [Bacteroidota bacterium]